MLPGKEIFFLFIASFIPQLTTASNTKHMYALCPPDFFGIGTECYYISENKVNWLDAHFDCKDRKSRLAEPIKYEDRMIRKFLLNNDQKRESKWIGGTYNWAKKKWQWQDGKEFIYQSFSQMPGGAQELQYHCAILNPNLNYRWSASSCVDKHQYICQHRMPYVNEKHRSRIYARWNQTYPNEKASEVEVVMNDADMLKRGHRQSIPITGRTTNVQRLSRHRSFLANEWLKKYRTHQIIVNRNRVPEGNYAVPQQRNVSARPKARRRNPNIGREDFLQFERKVNVNRGALITNRVDDDFNTPEPVSTAAPTSSHDFTRRRHYNREDDVTSAQPPPSPLPPRRYKNKDIDLKEQKRLEETRKMLETGRYEATYVKRRTTSTTTTTTTTEANVGIEDNERIEQERIEHGRIEQERIEQERIEQERIEQERIEQERIEQERLELERNRDLENRRKEMQDARERKIQEERLQNQIDEETLRIERDEEYKKLQFEEDDKRQEDERQRIHQQHVRDREEKIRQREEELREREEEEQKLRHDEEKRQEENRQQLEEIERKKQEEQEKERIDGENKRIEEEKRRRKKEELKEKQKQKENRISESSEEGLNDLRLKEKLRREKLAKLKERIKNLSPEDKLKFLELRARGKRNKKESDGKENETTTNQL